MKIILVGVGEGGAASEARRPDKDGLSTKGLGLPHVCRVGETKPSLMGVF
jgi:hypothetical protein